MLKQTQIYHPFLRNWLIRSAKNLESMLMNGNISENTPIRTTKWCGLIVAVTVEKKGEKPPIFRYTFRMDQSKAKEFFQTHNYLFEGPLVFKCCGIEFIIPDGKNRFKRAGYRIYADTLLKHEVWLDLWNTPVSFTVHRDVISHNDWCIFMEDPSEGYLAEEMAHEMGGVS